MMLFTLTNGRGGLHTTCLFSSRARVPIILMGGKLARTVSQNSTIVSCSSPSPTHWRLGSAITISAAMVANIPPMIDLIAG
jgi:hypothetical protein